MNRKKLIIEFIGTLFLVMVIGLTSNPVLQSVTSFNGPLIIGTVLMIMVYMGGHISGAHYNPAVTFAVALRGRLGREDMLLYWMAQIFGALTGAVLSYWLIGSSVQIGIPDHTTIGILKAVGVEIIFTFALALVVLNVATANNNSSNSFYGLAIGFTIFVAATVGAPFSGGAFNPAVGLGHDIISGHLQDVWVYIVGPLTGGAVAASVFRMTNGPEEFTA